MIQELKAEDAIYEIEATLDHPTVITFHSGLLAMVISEADNLHKITPIAELLFEAHTPGLYALTVDLVNGRNATYVFYNEDLTSYTLSIDGESPWTEAETLKLPGVRQAVRTAHTTKGVSRIKITYKAVV